MRKKIATNLSGKTNPRTKKPYTESEIYAIATTQFKKSKKEIKVCSTNFEFKEEPDRFVSEGFIATTHPDRAEDPEGRWVGDIIPEEMIDKIVDTINSQTVPEAKYASYRHDYLKQKDPSLPPAGIAIKAEKKQTDDGHWGAFVTTEHLKTFPGYDDLKYDVEKHVIPGYSIEYQTKDYEITNLDGENYRLLKDFDYGGYGFANARLQANTHANITAHGYKEMKEMINKEQKEGDNTMSEEKKPEDNAEEKPEEGTEEKPEGEEAKPEGEEATEDAGKEEEKPGEAAEPEGDKPEGEAKEIKVSKEDYTRLQKLKEIEVKEKVDTEFKERFQNELKEMQPKDAPFINPTGEKEFKELKVYKDRATTEYKEIFENYKHPVSANGQYAHGSHLRKAAALRNNVAKQYKEATQMAHKLSEAGVPFLKNWTDLSQSGEIWNNAKERMTHFDVGGEVVGGNPEAYGPYAGTMLEAKESYWDRFEMKASGLGAFNATNANVNKAHASWTYGSYYQSPVELNDIYGPALINQLNDQTVTWGKLKKENWAGRSQIQFRARTARNATAGGYTEASEWSLSDFSGYVGKDKFQQPFCYYHVFVAVTGQMIQFAQQPGGIGDIWGVEMQYSGIDLTKTLNAAILGSGDGTSESAALGFETIMQGTTGNLYGRDVATYTTLKSHQESVSARITIDQMRKMIQYVTGGDSSLTNSNANEADIVFFTHPVQVRFIKGLIQDMQRTVPTSARIGYEGTVELDGIPVFPDPQIQTDDLFLVDTMHTKLAINLGPTIEFLPVVFDGKAAHIKIYFNLYCDAPLNNYWVDSLSTS